VYGLGLLRRCRGATADRPDRLVGDYGTDHGLGARPVDDDIKLARNDLLGLTRIALCPGFTNAQNRSQPARPGSDELLGDQGIGLAELRAALGMAENDETGAAIDQHRGRNLACHRAFGTAEQVLRTEPDTAPRQGLRQLGEMQMRGTHDDVDPALQARQRRLEGVEQLPVPRTGAVHLPIGNDELAAHVPDFPKPGLASRPQKQGANTSRVATAKQGNVLVQRLPEFLLLQAAFTAP